VEILQVNSTQRSQWIDISSQLERLIRDKGTEHGFCLLFVPHTTAAITINEGADPSVKEDVLAVLSKLVPADGSYNHMEGNSDAHVKSTLVGPSIIVPIRNGKLDMGTWQSVFFCEFDGPRNRKVQVHLMEDPSAS